MLGEASISLHQPGINFLFGIVQFVPGAHTRRPIGKLSVLRDQALGLHIGQGLLTHGIPALVEFTFIFLYPLWSDMVRGVGGTKG